jgi:hypothetical protein
MNALPRTWVPHISLEMGGDRWSPLYTLNGYPENKP